MFLCTYFHVPICFHMPHVNMTAHKWRTEECEQLVRLYENQHYNTTSTDYKDKKKRMVDCT